MVAVVFDDLAGASDGDGSAEAVLPPFPLDLGGGVLTGLPMLRDAALALGEGNSVAHHVTNIVLTEVADDRVHALSKGIGINAAGTAGSVTYEDTIVRGDGGWRISHRTVRARRLPLTR